MSPAVDVDYEVRRYREDDEPQVLALLVASLGEGPAGTRTAEFFRWKHLDNPFGPSFMLLAEQAGKVIGFRSFMRWRFRCGDGEIRCVRAVDTATHPEHQGRGVFSRLTLNALDALNDEADLVFNTPNSKSGPGYLKMGWRRAGTLPASVRVLRPLRFARNLRSLRSEPLAEARPPIDAPPATEALADDDEVRSLLGHLSHGRRLTTARSLEYLRWRYADAPLLDYRALTVRSGGELQGLAIFRVRPRGKSWESTVAELLVAPSNERTARALLRRLAKAAAVDHLTAHFPPRTTAARATLRAGFLPAGRGLDLFINPLRHDIEPPPDDIRSWALSLGDLEVF